MFSSGFYRNLLYVLLALVLIAGAFFMFSGPTEVVSEPGDTAMIILTNDGFEPQSVTVKKSAKITFKNETGKSFWPASNLHPSHEIYPEFDPHRPLQPEETWEFAFDHVGTWPYHDHIRSYYIGVVHVIE